MGNQFDRSLVEKEKDENTFLLKNDNVEKFGKSLRRGIIHEQTPQDTGYSQVVVKWKDSCGLLFAFILLLLFLVLVLYKWISL